MTFEEYKTDIWTKEHSLSMLWNEDNDIIIKLDTCCLQKIEWIEYCIKNGCADQINHSVINDMLESLMSYFKAIVCDSSVEHCSFATPRDIHLKLYKICKNNLLFSKEEIEKMDDIFLDRMTDTFNEIYKKNLISFNIILEKILSWFDYRQEFCNKVQIGFSPCEYYIPTNFYVKFKKEFLAARNTNYENIVKFAEYSIWLYNNAKNIPRQYMIGDLIKFNRFAIQCCRNALVSAQCNGYFEFIDSIKNKIRDIQSDIMSNPTVFISYNWGNEKLVDEIQKIIGSYVTVKRDVNELGIGDNITEFMNTIREEDFALVIISDAYLKSDACMYELTTLFKDQGEINFKNKVMFVVCDDARSVYDTDGRVTYTEFWDNRYRKLIEHQKALTPETSVEITQNIRTVAYIRLQIGEFLEYVKTVNNFSEKDIIQKVTSFIAKKSTDGKIGRNPIEDLFIAMKK